MEQKQKYYADMKKILLTCMILVPFIPFILALIIGYSYFTAALENTTIATMKRISEDHRHMIESFLSERKSDLEFIIQLRSFEELRQPEMLRNLFEQLQKKSGAFMDLGIFDEEGVHVAYQGTYKLTGKIYKQEDWFTEVIKKGYYISDVFMGFRKVPHFIIAIAKEDMGKKWVIRSTIDTYLFNELVKKVRIGKTGEAYILNTNGIFQTDRRSGGNLMGSDPDYQKYITAETGVKIFIDTDTKGESYLYATTWMKEKKWLLVVRQEKADAFKTLRSAVYLIVIISLIGGAIIVSVAFYITDRIIRRMEQADTEKDRLREQLIRAHRLAELGQMSTGFAHEINNPLQIIKSEQSLIEMILSELKEKGELKDSESLKELDESVAQIRLQIERCAKITQSILKFGRQSEPTYQDVLLQEFIPEIAEMVAKQASVHGIRMRLDIAENTPMIYGDPGQLQQVLLNLLNNAMDAIAEKYGVRGGELIIQARSAETEGNAEISVSDNGSGISSEDQEKIFSPFFTTKAVGKGTGLGLSVCYGIINSMGGTMAVSSQQGIGTTFTLRIPASKV